jgi:hypothetical protein
MPIGLILPDGLDFAGWVEIGLQLGRSTSALAWWRGDWWNRGGLSRMGSSLSSGNYQQCLWRVTGEVVFNQTGFPSYQTCANAGWVCHAFPLSRRREKLLFSHHAEIAGCPPQCQDELLDWCEGGIAETGRPRSIRQLREEIQRRWPPHHRGGSRRKDRARRALERALAQCVAAGLPHAEVVDMVEASLRERILRHAQSVPRRRPAYG